MGVSCCASITVVAWILSDRPSVSLIGTLSIVSSHILLACSASFDNPPTEKSRLNHSTVKQTGLSYG